MYIHLASSTFSYSNNHEFHSQRFSLDNNAVDYSMCWNIFHVCLLGMQWTTKCDETYSTYAYYEMQWTTTCGETYSTYAYWECSGLQHVLKHSPRMLTWNAVDYNMCWNILHLCLLGMQWTTTCGELYSTSAYWECSGLQHVVKHTPRTLTGDAVDYNVWWNILHVCLLEMQWTTTCGETYSTYAYWECSGLQHVLKHSPRMLTGNAVDYNMCWNILHLCLLGMQWTTTCVETYSTYAYWKCSGLQHVVKHTPRMLIGNSVDYKCGETYTTYAYWECSGLQHVVKHTPRMLTGNAVDYNMYWNIFHVCLLGMQWTTACVETYSTYVYWECIGLQHVLKHTPRMLNGNALDDNMWWNIIHVCLLGNAMDNNMWWNILHVCLLGMQWTTTCV